MRRKLVLIDTLHVEGVDTVTEGDLGSGLEDKIGKAMLDQLLRDRGQSLRAFLHECGFEPSKVDSGLEWRPLGYGFDTVVVDPLVVEAEHKTTAGPLTRRFTKDAIYCDIFEGLEPKQS